MNCDNTLWIDAVGFYYIAQNFNIDINKLIITIATEINPYPRKKLGILLDGNSTELCTAYESPPDIKYVRTLRPIAEAFDINYTWYVKKGDCKYACIDKHELYTALCKCRPDHLFLIAECNCGQLKEGANRSQLPCGQNCRNEDRCLLLISCPATT
jgi:hypothetical protein